MTSDVPGYSPISCDFYDILEAAATTHKVVHVRYLDEEGAVQHRKASIVDVFSRNGVEYLSVSTGETLRLDRLIAVDHDKLADY